MRNVANKRQIITTIDNVYSSQGIECKYINELRSVENVFKTCFRKIKILLTTAAILQNTAKYS
jgi:hypothetical protein